MSDGIKEGLQIGVTYRVGLASSLTVIRRRSRPTTTTSMEAATPPLSPTRQQGKKRRNFLTWGVGFFFNRLWGFVGFLESVGFGLREPWDLNLVWGTLWDLREEDLREEEDLGKMARTWDGGGGLGMVVGGGRLNF